MRALRKPPPSTLYFAGAFNSHIYFPDAAPQLLQRNLACSIVSRSDLTPCPEGSTVCVLVGSIPLSAAEAIPGLVGAFSLCRPSQQHRHKQQAVSQITAESVLGSESRQLVFFKNLEKGGTMQKQKGHMKGRSIKNDDADLPNKTKVWYRGIRFPWREKLKRKYPLPFFPPSPKKRNKNLIHAHCFQCFQLDCPRISPPWHPHVVTATIS